MGFATGFTGGVTLTLGVAYLTALAHQRNRERQADILRANAIVLNTLSAAPGANPVPLPPSRAEIEAVRRAHFVEAAKDKWNAEIEGAVRWAQNKDWNRVREDVEGAAGRVWARATGGGVEDGAARAKEEAVSVERRAEAEARSVSKAAREKVEESRARTASTLQDKAAEAKATAAEAIQRGVDKGRELVGKAQAAVGLVEDKVVAAATGETTESDVERALRQRFEPAALQTVEQAYAERYTPIDRTGHSKLRAV